MDVPVTVISGADPTFSQPIFNFVSDLCKTSEIELILQPGAEHVLGETHGLNAHDMKLHVMRDLIRTKAERLQYRGPRLCMLVGYFRDKKDEVDFEKVKRILAREQEQIENWHIFRDFRQSCLMSDPVFIYFS